MGGDKALRHGVKPLKRLFPILVGVSLVLCPAAAADADEAPAAPLRNAFGLGVSVRTLGVPFLAAALYSDDLTLTVEAGEAQHTLLDVEARTRLIMGLARYRLPIAWNDWRPAADLGFLTVSAQAAGVELGASGFTVGAGVERPLTADGSWHLRGEARYIRILNRSHWLAGISLERRFRLPDSPAAPGLGGAGSPGQATTGVPVAAVSASGRITRVSLPMSVSGSWEVYADLRTRSASLFLEGTADGVSGSYGFSNATWVSFDGRTLSITFEESATHEGMPVRGTVYVSVSPASFSVSISARRSDGLSASAGISGVTTSFEVVPLQEEE